MHAHAHTLTCTNIYTHTDTHIRTHHPSLDLLTTAFITQARIEDDSVDLGINAEDCGNEIRFINSYLNIGEANCVMRTTTLNSLPHIVIVCTKHIPKSSEILLDYGDAYNNKYILQKTRFEPPSPIELFDHLPYLDEDESSTATAAVSIVSTADA